MSTYDARKFYLDAIRTYPSGHTTEERNIDIVQRAFNAGLSRAETLVRGFHAPGYRTTWDASMLADAISRERTPALCAETRLCVGSCDAPKCNNYCARSLDHRGLHRCQDHGGDTADAEILPAPVAAEPTPREPEKCDRCAGRGGWMSPAMANKYIRCSTCKGTGRAASGTPGAGK